VSTCPHCGAHFIRLYASKRNSGLDMQRLAKIAAMIERDRRVPTYKEMAKELGFEYSGGAEALIGRLTERGFVSTRVGKHRSLKLTDLGKQEIAKLKASEPARKVQHASATL